MTSSTSSSSCGPQSEASGGCPRFATPSSGSKENQSPPNPPSQSSANNSQTRLHQDISRLRVDKLELLRQALSAQHEVRQLRQHEAQLETDLALAAAEIRRLKNQLKSTTVAVGVVWPAPPGPGSNPSQGQSESQQQQQSPAADNNRKQQAPMPKSVQQNSTMMQRTVQMHIP